MYCASHYLLSWHGPLLLTIYFWFIGLVNPQCILRNYVHYDAVSKYHYFCLACSHDNVGTMSTHLAVSRVFSCVEVLTCIVQCPYCIHFEDNSWLAYSCGKWVSLLIEYLMADNVYSAYQIYSATFCSNKAQEWI